MIPSINLLIPSTHLLLFCYVAGRRGDLIPRGGPYFFFFFFFVSNFLFYWIEKIRQFPLFQLIPTDWWGIDICGLLQLLVARFHQIPYLSNFLIAPDPRTWVEYPYVFTRAHTQIFIRLLQNEVNFHFNIVTSIKYFSN